jgi:hypothetical protein
MRLMRHPAKVTPFAVHRSRPLLKVPANWILDTFSELTALGHNQPDLARDQVGRPGGARPADC